MKKKKVFKIIWNIIQILIVIYAITIISFMYASNRFGYSEVGNYVLNIKNNDLLFILKDTKYKVGDKVYYYAVVKERYSIISGKITDIDKNKVYVVLNGEKVPFAKLIGKTYTKVPILGWILKKLKNLIYFMLFVSLPLLIVFSYQTYKFIKEKILKK